MVTYYRSDAPPTNGIPSSSELRALVGASGFGVKVSGGLINRTSRSLSKPPFSNKKKKGNPDL
jgi:hypothetical protein